MKRDFNNIQTRTTIKFFFFLQGKAPKKIHSILRETLREHALSYATFKNWMAKFKHGDFSTVMRLVLDDPKQWPPRKIIDQIHELIFEECWISAKSIAEQLGISREWVGFFIHEDMDRRFTMPHIKPITFPPTTRQLIVYYHPIIRGCT